MNAKLPCSVRRAIELIVLYPGVVVSILKIM